MIIDFPCRIIIRKTRDSQVYNANTCESYVKSKRPLDLGPESNYMDHYRDHLVLLSF